MNTVTYVEKGSGLVDALVAAGHGAPTHRADGTTLIQGDPVAAQAIIDNYPLSSAIEEMKQRIDGHAKQIRQAFLAANDAGDADSWGTKLEEAKAFNANPVEPTDVNDADARGMLMIYVEAVSASVTTASIAARVMANSSAYKQFEGAVAGRARAHKDAVALLATFETVLSYDFTTGWPA